MKRAHDTIASIVRSFSHIQFISGIIAHGPYSVFKIVENYTLACPTPRHVDFVHTDSGKNFTQGNVEPFVTVGVTARAAASYIPNLFLESSRMYDSHFSALWHYRRKSGEILLANHDSPLSITSPDTDVSIHHEDCLVQQNVTNDSNLRRKEIRIKPERHVRQLKYQLRLSRPSLRAR
ncbi:hypothetical protein BLNAU_17064 [Blattamonas nauphoetae]|uniref:Uncharacterized protein n=1 Tax=Blattamonas nauphoetae TaxID=2049346 RepID=A0ABQ9WSI8_9EUKA|nr:hypothetical protein BLNAU_22613 [Blattamonas nauphoetae]KAK2948028.1 hypothetical protein BLNAU_17064 [Blattamonas nauphoetae]